MNRSEIDQERWRQHAWVNRLQSFALLAFLAVFLGLLGWLFWGIDGIVVLLLVGALGVVVNPSLSPRWVMHLYGASPIGPENAPVLWRAVAHLAERAGLPAQPALYYVPSSLLNAFAVGSRRQSAVAVTDGLLRQLSPRELTAVLAHEISHIRSNDLWVMGLADMFSRATSMLSLIGQFLLILSLPLMLFSTVAINWFAILLLVFAPHLSALAQLALSRAREYDADLNAVRLTRDPEGLASALARIERVQGGWLERIVLPGRRIPEPSLLRTHPDTADRVDRLMALKPAYPEADPLYEPDSRIDRGQRLGDPVVRSPRWHINGLWH